MNQSVNQWQSMDGNVRYRLFFQTAACIIPALCPPTNLEGHVDCSTNVLTVTWDSSSVFGTDYSLKVERVGTSTPPDYYNTSDTSLNLSGLQCGQRYVFHVAVVDGTCTSNYSLPMEISTGRALVSIANIHYLLK